METFKILKINDRDVKVSKLPLGRYADLLEALEGLPKEFTDQLIGLDKADEGAILGKLPSMIRTALPQFEKVVSVVSGLEVEYIDKELGLTDVVLIIKTMFEVNDYLSLKNVFSSAMKNIRESRGEKVTPVAG